MHTYTRLLPLLVALLAMPEWAMAAPASAACTVQINYTVNGTPVATYTSSFTVARDAVFLDDQSTPTRRTCSGPR
ncbi:MAG: hypothetical protein R2708_25785 [Vicinamibacterales bacterium]